MATLLAGGLAACREEEQGRILPIEDRGTRVENRQPLTQEQVQEIEDRVRLQSF